MDQGEGGRHFHCMRRIRRVEVYFREAFCLQEMLVAAGDMGRDYEHCLELQKKVNDVEAVSYLIALLEPNY